MANKMYGLQYLQITTAQESTLDLFDVLSNAANSQIVSQQVGHEVFQVDISKVTDDRVECVFVKFRDKVDAPNIGEPDQIVETPIPYPSDRATLKEKNYFIVYKQNGVIAYQVNTNGSHKSKLSAYFTSVCSETVSLNDIVSKESLQKLIDDKVDPIKIRVKVQEVQIDPRLRSDDVIVAGIQEEAKVSGAITIERVLSVGNTKSVMQRDILTSIKNLHKFATVKQNKIKFQDAQGEKDEVDLVAEKIKDRISVNVKGRYADPQSVYLAIRASYSALVNRIDEAL